MRLDKLNHALKFLEDGLVGIKTQDFINEAGLPEQQVFQISLGERLAQFPKRVIQEELRKVTVPVLKTEFINGMKHHVEMSHRIMQNRMPVQVQQVWNHEEQRWDAIPPAINY